MKRVVLALAAALLGLLVFAVPAQAAPRSIGLPGGDIDCKEQPIPQAPGRGLVGFFESEPTTLPIFDDPFTEGAKTSIYQQYGYAGLRWSTYDLGCGPDISRNPDGVVGSAVANWIMTIPVAAVAATSAVLAEAFKPDFLSALDPLIIRVVDGLRTAVFEKWAAIPLGALGLMLIWHSRKMRLASTALAIGWALLIMVAVTTVFRWPLVAGHTADSSVAAVLGTVATGLDGASDGQDASLAAASGMHRSLLYEAWLGGEFGRADSDVARRYGPVILDATSLTWREAQLVDADPVQGAALIKAKQAKFKQAAEKIQEEDPDAYTYLTGQRSDARVGYALLALLATMCAVPFLFMAGLLVIGALLIVRFGVMLFPAFATLGLFHPLRSVVLGVANTCAAALINAVVFGAGALAMVAAMGVLLAPSAALSGWLAIILMLLLTVVMWVALKPFRRLTQMVGQSRSAFGEALHGPAETAKAAGRHAAQAAVVATGTAVGALTAARVHDVAVEPSQTPRSEAVTTYDPIPLDEPTRPLPAKSEPEQRPEPPVEPPKAPAQPKTPLTQATPVVLPTVVPPAPDGAPASRFEASARDDDWDTFLDELNDQPLENR